MPQTSLKPPKISSVKRGMITIEKPLGGWAPRNVHNSYVEGDEKKGQYSYSTYVDLFESLYLGQIAPGHQFDAITDTNSLLSGLPLNAVSTQNPTYPYYAVLDNDSLVSFNSTQTIQSTGIALVGVHSGHSLVPYSNNQDCVMYKDTAGDVWIIWSWEDTTDGDLALITSAGASQTSNWFSGTLTQAQTTKVLVTGVPHMLAIGADANIYVTNGQYIAQASNLVGAIPPTGNGDTQKLNLGPGWIATSLVPWQNFLVITGYKATTTTPGTNTSLLGAVRVWFWDYANTNPNYIFDLQDNYASAVYVDNQTTSLLVFTTGLDNKTRIWKYNGSSFDAVIEMPTSAIQNPPAHGSICNYFMNICFRQGSGNYDVMQFYSPNNSIHYMMPAGTTTGQTFRTVTAAGFIKNLDTLGIYVGNNESGTYRIGKINVNEYVRGAVFYDLIRSLPTKSRIVQIEFYFSQFGTGASITASLYSGYTSTPDLLNRQITNAANGVINQFVIPCNIFPISDFWLKILFDHTTIGATAAIIRKVEIIYEYTDEKL